MEKIKQKSDTAIFIRMIKELGKLRLLMVLTILLGTAGFFAAASVAIITVLAAVGIIGEQAYLSMDTAIILIIIAAASRGLLHYAEQLCGHYIAFKILAILRDKMYAKLRKLAPAKLDDKEKGNIISIITSDIELMEVFYAHTIAPVMIALISSIIYVIVLSHIHIWYGLTALIFYILIGIVLPLVIRTISTQAAEDHRNRFGVNSTFLLESLRGIKEIILFSAQKGTSEKVNENTEKMRSSAKRLKKYDGISTGLTNMIIVVAILINLCIGYTLFSKSIIDKSHFVIALVIFSVSFGPVVALSALSTTLASTVASAKRVFELLDETPIIKENFGDEQIITNDICYQNIVFKYPKRDFEVLKNIELFIPDGQKIAIIGPSGCGKSTLLKLLMRFYDPKKGEVIIGNNDIKKLPSKSLEQHLGTSLQDTFIFNDTIEKNIRLENSEATIDDVIEVAKKAAIHETIITFPKGYQTIVGEFGSRLSSGEKQRIALARIFLKDSKVILLDEPTSNLDVLNEALILRSIDEYSKDKTVILVSHRTSTTGICDRVVVMEDGKIV